MEEQRKNKKSEPVDWLLEALTLARYFDSYGALFDEHQREIFEDYICHDMSLAEIADREGMTRQGVSDLVKRISRKLHEYEESLHLSERTEQAERIVSELQNRIMQYEAPDTVRTEMKELLRRLMNVL